jgi:amino acid adenylation domain-containing protein
VAFLLWQYLKDSARRWPRNPAVAWRSEVLTYGDLDEQSDRLAALLRSAGIGPGTRVGLYLPKSHRSVVGMLAILKAGAAYVPVDPGAPPKRAAYILDNCGIRGLVTTGTKAFELSDHFAELPALALVLLADDGDVAAPSRVTMRRWSELGQFPADAPSPDVAVETDPAYLLYTSGSTGTPKGVILTHRNALTFVDWAADAFAIGPQDRLSNHAPLHFDLSVFDIYAAIRAGACTVIVPDQVSPFPVELARWIEAERISVWYSVPSALTRLLLHGQLERFAYRSLRTVLFAGEVFPVKYLRGVMDRFAHAEFANLYGPTETNVCTFYRVPRPFDPGARDVPIGTACANTEVFALTEDQRLIGAGEEGDLFVRGPSVTPGYWGLPEKSAQVLLKNPRQNAFAETIYRTGDIVRLRGDGEYMFVGRRDHMVKSRGYRIELAEIEQVLYQHEHVKEAAVVPVPDEEVGARLRAVVTPHAGKTVTAEQLQMHCLTHLPIYMVPESFTFRPDLPKTSTGKTDRLALLRSLAAGTEEATTL